MFERGLTNKIQGVADSAAASATRGAGSPEVEEMTARLKAVKESGACREHTAARSEADSISSVLARETGGERRREF